MFISRPDYKFEGCLYIVGTEIGLIFTLVKIKCVYWNQSVPRWGSKSAVLCGETAQGLMLLFVRGFLQFLVKPPLCVVPPPFEFLLSCQCHLYHYLLIICKLEKFNFVAKTMFVLKQSFPSSLFSHFLIFITIENHLLLMFHGILDLCLSSLRHLLHVVLINCKFNKGQLWPKANLVINQNIPCPHFQCQPRALSHLPPAP